MALISEIHLISGINRMCHHVLLQGVFIVLFEAGVTIEPRLALSWNHLSFPSTGNAGLGHQTLLFFLGVLGPQHLCVKIPQIRFFNS